MKSILYISTILTIFSCEAQQTGGVLMNPILKPNLIYHTTALTENNAIIEYLGNVSKIEKLKSKGIEYPITSNSRNLIESTIHTGKLDKNQEFTVKCTYEKAVSEISGSITKLKDSDNAIENLQGAQVYGKMNEELQIEIDSIIGLKGQSLRTTIEQGMKTFLTQIEYPKESIKKGGHFTTITPFKFPVENGSVVDMVNTKIYFLDSISSSLAYFSFYQQIKVETEIEQTGSIVKGLGFGNIQYDLINHSIKLYYTELEINSEVEVHGFKVKTIALTKSTIMTEIRKPDDNRR